MSSLYPIHDSRGIIKLFHIDIITNCHLLLINNKIKLFVGLR